MRRHSHDTAQACRSWCYTMWDRWPVLPFSVCTLNAQQRLLYVIIKGVSSQCKKHHQLMNQNHTHTQRKTKSLLTLLWSSGLLFNKACKPSKIASNDSDFARRDCCWMSVNAAVLCAVMQFRLRDKGEWEYCGQGHSHKHRAVVRFGPVTRVTPT